MNEQLLKASGANVLSSRRKLRETLGEAIQPPPLYVRGLIPSTDVIQLTFKMTTAAAPAPASYGSANRTHPTYEMTPGFKTFAIIRHLCNWS